MYNDGSVYLGRPGVYYISTSLKADTPQVRWQWHCGDQLPSVHVSRTMYVKKDAVSIGKQWRMRYPEVAPPGARYELVVDETPPLTPEQEEVVTHEKAALVEIWEQEKAIQNRLLALWIPYKESMQEAIAITNGDRWLVYKNTIYVKGAPFSIFMVVTAKYISKPYTPDDQYQVVVELELVSGDEYIRLNTLKLPVLNGKASPTPLVEYLSSSPLLHGARALSKVARAIQTQGDSND